MIRSGVVARAAFVTSMALAAVAHGDAWVQSDAGLLVPRTGTVVLVPGQPKTLYVATTHGLFRSVDDGTHWREVLVDHTRHATAFAIDPRRANELYAGVGGALFASKDSGRSWQARTTPEPLGVLSAIVIAPTTPRTLYAVHEGRGLGVSRDDGMTFTHGTWNNGLDGDIARVAVDSVKPSIAYAMGRDGFRVTTDAGVTWAHFGDAREDGSAFATSARTTGLSYEASPDGIRVSSDAGMSWSPVRRKVASIAFAVDARHDRTAWAATRRDGLQKTTDGGKTWSRVDVAMPQAAYVSLTVDDTHPGTLYAGRTDGVYRSRDSGRTWSNLGIGETAGNEMRSVVFDPAVPHVAYARRSTKEMFASFDGGAHWNALGATDRWHVLSLAAAPSDPNIMYALTVQGVYRSADHGQSWSFTGDGLLEDRSDAHANIDFLRDATGEPVQSLFVDAHAAEIVYVGVRARGVFKSLDAGKTWHLVSAGLSPSSRDSDPFELALVADHSILRSGTPMLRLSNEGERWQAASPATMSPFSATVTLDFARSRGSLHPHTSPQHADASVLAPPLIHFVPQWCAGRPETGYGISEIGLVRTRDHGNTWALVQSPAGSFHVSTFAIDPTHPESVLVATDAGIYRTETGGE